MKIILASSSPRRRELMEQAGIPFETDVSDTDETIEDKLSPSDYVEELSLRKARAVAARHAEDTVIGADTVVALGDRILGKPVDEAEAYEMLRLLAGKTHSPLFVPILLFRLGKRKSPQGLPLQAYESLRSGYS